MAMYVISLDNRANEIDEQGLALSLIDHSVPGRIEVYGVFGESAHEIATDILGGFVLTKNVGTYEVTVEQYEVDTLEEDPVLVSIYDVIKDKATTILTGAEAMRSYRAISHLKRNKTLTINLKQMLL